MTNIEIVCIFIALNCAVVAVISLLNSRRQKQEFAKIWRQANYLHECLHFDATAIGNLRSDVRDLRMAETSQLAELTKKVAVLESRGNTEITRLNNAWSGIEDIREKSDATRDGVHEVSVQVVSALDQIAELRQHCQQLQGAASVVDEVARREALKLIDVRDAKIVELSGRMDLLVVVTDRHADEICKLAEVVRQIGDIATRAKQ